MSQVHSEGRWSYELSYPADVALSRLEEVAAKSQYGWGQTVELAAGVCQQGFLGVKWRQILATFDGLGWLGGDLRGKAVADVGCFSGAMSLSLADRGAKVVAVDEVPEHLEQARVLADVFGAGSDLTCVSASLYDLHDHLDSESLDVVVLSGVLYHLSDMLAGLIAAQQLLKPGGRLLIQTNAVENFEASYANFGRFYAGWWWQPTALCIRDMTEFAGLTRADVHFYEPGRCVARAEKPSEATDPQDVVPFKRGIHWSFSNLDDSEYRHLDASALAPAPDPKGDRALARRWVSRVASTATRRLISLAAGIRARFQGARR